MDRKDKLLAGCTAAIIATLVVCTTVITHELRYATPDPESVLEETERLDGRMLDELQCIDYRLMSLSEKINDTMHRGNGC